jgi:hypothetical protein
MHSTAIDPILSKPNAKDKTNLDRVNLEEELWDIDEETNFFIKDEIIRCTEHACGRFKLPVYVTDDWVVRRWYLHCQGFTHVRAREARRRSEVPDELEMKIAVHTTKSSGMDVRQKVEGEDEAVEDEDVNVESRKPSSPEKIGLVGEDVISHGHFVSLGPRNLPSCPSSFKSMWGFSIRSMTIYLNRLCAQLRLPRRVQRRLALKTASILWGICLTNQASPISWL